ncbi:ParB N-terminal domain-containing protein, partial [Streptomyces turgidiscabies]
MIIQTIPIDRLNAAAYNPRVDLQPGDPEYEKLRHSIENFGYVEPIVWNERTGNIVGGHQRYKVLQARGDPAVEVSVVDLDDQQERLLNLA